MKNYSFILNFVFFTFIFTSTSTFAQNADNRNNHFNLTKGIAAEGFDPVTLFLEKKPLGRTVLFHIFTKELNTFLQVLKI